MKSYHSSQQHGFSLVETVLAIGIMALAVTALLGLLPHGIEMTRQAGNEAAFARILNTMRTELMRMPQDSLDSAGESLPALSFDEQGIMIPQGTSNSGANSQAFLAKADFQGLRNNPIVLTGGSGRELQVLNFAVHIAATGLSTYDFRNAPAKSYRTYPVLVGPNFNTYN